MRQWYDNDGSAGEQNASLTTTIPGPFTLNGGSTEVCLNPSTTNPSAPNGTELVCESSAEGAVWSGKDLQVSPSAGHYGESNGSTSGDLAAGRKRYLNLHRCEYMGGTFADRVVNIVEGYGGAEYSAGTNASNTADVAASCGTGAGPWSLYQAHVQAVDLLGNRYLNLHQCEYKDQNTSADLRITNVLDGYGGAEYSAGTNASNTADAAASCGTGAGPWSLYQAHVQAVDLLGNRYLNLHQCEYKDQNTSADLRITNVLDGYGGAEYSAGTNASNTADAAASCGTGAGPWSLYQAHVQALDLLDTARGRGYVQYAISAPDDLDAFCASNPSNPLEESYTQDGTLTSTPSGAKASSGDLTIVWGDDPANPPCESSIPMIDPQVGGIVAGLTAVAGAAYVLHRRRRVATI